MPANQRFRNPGKWLLLGCLLNWSLTTARAQSGGTFTRADSLRGTLSPLRSCFDVTYYDLSLRVNPTQRSIEGQNTIHYKVVNDFSRLQLDLFENLNISRITQEGRALKFKREGNVVFVDLAQKKGTQSALTVYYAGKPTVAKRPPWDGGFSWEKDSTGKTWVAVSCEGVGASLWWPCKDHPSDEPDSMRIRCEVPKGLGCVSNGNLHGQKPVKDGYVQYDWRVSYPINLYNVTLNIADYAHFSDTYTNAAGEKLALDYYVLRYNEAKARTHFAQVKPMLASFEKHFGPYPFPRDGYALVETPYWGMEHQSAVAYGNQYRNNPFGFDFIIIHESGHEWWGNSVSCRDHAELWIHESFCTYAEALYVEDTQGYAKALEYLEVKKKNIKNQHPILGAPGVNYNRWPDSDMYPKGAWMLHTLRNVIDNDSLWMNIIHGLATDFKRQIVSSEQVIDYIEQKAGKDFTTFFDQYLKHTQPPTLEYKLWAKGRSVSLQYRWKADVPGFAMPVKVGFETGKYQTLHPTTEWQTILLDGDQADFRVATELFYVKTQE